MHKKGEEMKLANVILAIVGIVAITGLIVLFNGADIGQQTTGAAVKGSSAQPAPVQSSGTVPTEQPLMAQPFGGESQ